MAKHDTFPALPHAEGPTLLTCPACEAPLSTSDLAELGLRAPEPGETVEAYCDAELLDPGELRHLLCLEDDGEFI